MSTLLNTIDLVVSQVLGLKNSILLYNYVTFFTACIVVRISFARVSCYMHGRPFIWFTSEGGGFYMYYFIVHNFTTFGHFCYVLPICKCLCTISVFRNLIYNLSTLSSARHFTVQHSKVCPAHLYVSCVPVVLRVSTPTW